MHSASGICSCIPGFLLTYDLGDVSGNKKPAPSLNGAGSYRAYHKQGKGNQGSEFPVPPWPVPWPAPSGPCVPPKVLPMLLMGL